MGNCCCRCSSKAHHQVKHNTSVNLTKPSSPDVKPGGENINPAVSLPRESGGGEEDIRMLVVPPESPAPVVGRVITPNLKIFTLGELMKATRNFRPDTMLGEGGFGRVFKGWVDEKTLEPARVGVGIPVAVKKSNPDSSQGLQEWLSEVKFLGKFSHPNLVKLLGYCWEDRQFLLVYEYVQKGCLENHLFRNGPEPLTWDIRIKIAIGAARGLDFLHTSEKSVIFRDFKPSNILLDGDFNAELSDFGLAKLGPANGDSHVTTQVMGTYGYAAPEYVATGHLYVKSDVYGFGVVLLELLAGRQAVDMNRPTVQQNLVKWAKPSLSNKKRLVKMMDPRLEGRYPIEGAVQVAKLVLRCLEEDPKSRPSMDEVLATLEAVSAIRETRTAAFRQQQQRQQNHQHPRRHHHGGGNAGGIGVRLPRAQWHLPTGADHYDGQHLTF